MSTPRPISTKVVSGIVRVADLLVIVLSGMLAHYGYLYSASGLGLYGYVIGIGALLAAYVFQFAELYRFDRLSRYFYQATRVSAGWAVVVVVLITLAFLTKTSATFSRGWTVLWFVGSAVGFLAIRLVVKMLIARWISGGRLTRNIVIVGAGRHGIRLAEHVDDLDETGVRLLGFFDDRLSRIPEEVAGHPVLGTVDELLPFVRENRVDQVIVALPWSAEKRIGNLLRKLKVLPVDIRLSPEMMSFQFRYRRFSDLGGIHMLNVFDSPLSGWDLVVKGVEDRVLAAIIVILILPLMFAIAVLIKLDSPGPVLFRQKRYGFNNQLIDVFKFRTMHHDQRDDNAERLTSPGDPRVTRLGAFLRRSSLDELPQFINVLKGEMSVVGPRPHAVAAKADNKLYEEVVAVYVARHRVKPGITGWAQVNGLRGETDTVEKIQQRVEHDLYYIENWSLGFDIRILIKTLFVLVFGTNAH